MQRIADQVIQQSLHRHPAQRKRLDRLQTQVHFFFGLVVRRGDFTNNIAQVHLFHCLIAAIANERQELIENRIHVFDIANHVVCQVSAIAHQLKRQAQPGQRCAQVMGHPGQHQFPLTPGLLDVFGHLVEGAIDLGHFTRCITDWQTHAAALAELPSGIHQSLQRLVELADEDPCCGSGQQADGKKPAEHVPYFLAAKRMRIERDFQPGVPQAGSSNPQGRRRMHS